MRVVAAVLGLSVLPAAVAPYVPRAVVENGAPPRATGSEDRRFQRADWSVAVRAQVFATGCAVTTQSSMRLATQSSRRTQTRAMVVMQREAITSALAVAHGKQTLTFRSHSLAAGQATTPRKYPPASMRVSARWRLPVQEWRLARARKISIPMV